MFAKNYKHLAKVYDVDWGSFALNYVHMISKILVAKKIDKAKILDLACGSGNLAIRLAKSGHIVKGIDISHEMIQVAKKKSVYIQNVSFEVEDMTRFIVEEEYDVITCTYDSINYLIREDDVKKMFAKVFVALNNTGIFIFDFNTEQQYIKHHSGMFKKEIEGEIFIQKAIYKADEKIAQTEFKFKNGEIEIHKQRPYSLIEIKEILRKVGLIFVNVHSRFNEKEVTPESERIICITEKGSLREGKSTDNKRYTE